MIGLIIFIVVGFLILHVIICWVAVMEDILDYGYYYDKCYGCNSGFCMEEPDSEECLQIRKKLHIDEKDPGQ